MPQTIYDGGTIGECSQLHSYVKENEVSGNLRRERRFHRALSSGAGHRAIWQFNVSGLGVAYNQLWQWASLILSVI